MSDRGLVVRKGSLEAMEAALTKAHDDLVIHLDGLFLAVDHEISGWATSTESRSAQVVAQQRVRDAIDQLSDALVTVRTKVTEARELAHDAEVRNVAIVD